MGVLGWDIVSTVAFDFRLLRETSWSSVPSACHSIAYYLSRYANFAYIVLNVVNSVAPSNSCNAAGKAASALLGIGLCASELCLVEGRFGQRYMVLTGCACTRSHPRVLLADHQHLGA